MVFGIAMVKDEADVIGETVARMLDEVDAILIADNRSTDGTFEILHDFERTSGFLKRPRRPLVTVYRDEEPAYYQSRKMTRLAAAAAGFGADWVVPFDADERWYRSGGGSVAGYLEGLPNDVAGVTATLYDHVATGRDPLGSPMERMGWRRREHGALPKIAVRPVLPVTILQGNHGARWPVVGFLEGELVIRHFPYRSAEQFVRKVRNGAAAYAATDLSEEQGAHWRQYGRILDEHGPDVLTDEVFRRWFWCADPEADGELIFDPTP